MRHWCSWSRSLPILEWWLLRWRSIWLRWWRSRPYCWQRCWFRRWRRRPRRLRCWHVGSWGRCRRSNFLRKHIIPRCIKASWECGSRIVRDAPDLLPYQVHHLFEHANIMSSKVVANEVLRIHKSQLACPQSVYNEFMPLTSEPPFASHFTMMPCVGFSGRLCFAPFPAGVRNTLHAHEGLKPLK